MKYSFKKIPRPIFVPDQELDLGHTHAQLPIPFDLGNNITRVYYASRDANNISRIYFFDLDLAHPSKIIFREKTPVLEPGNLGSFDDSGVMPTFVMRRGGEIYLYYIGWTQRSSVPYQNSVGLACSDDGVNFKRKVPGPVLGTGPFDPFFVGTFWVLRLSDKSYRGYYLSCNGWTLVNQKPEPTYDIKLATSADGIFWKREGIVMLENDEHDQAIASSSILKCEDEYLMLYCSRNIRDYRESQDKGYRIRLATSLDGLSWKKDARQRFVQNGEAGVWDSDMQAYPYFFKSKSDIYVFYNGNGFGRSGIGLGKFERA